MLITSLLLLFAHYKLYIKLYFVSNCILLIIRYTIVYPFSLDFNLITHLYIIILILLLILLFFQSLFYDFSTNSYSISYLSSILLILNIFACEYLFLLQTLNYDKLLHHILFQIYISKPLYHR